MKICMQSKSHMAHHIDAIDEWCDGWTEEWIVVNIGAPNNILGIFPSQWLAEQFQQVALNNLADVRRRK